MICLSIEEFLDIVYSEYRDILPKNSKEEIIEKIMIQYNNKLRYRDKMEIGRLKLPQLKELCVLNRLKKTGNKKDLVDRLFDFFKD